MYYIEIFQMSPLEIEIGDNLTFLSLFDNHILLGYYNIEFVELKLKKNNCTIYFFHCY